MAQLWHHVGDGELAYRAGVGIWGAVCRLLGGARLVRVTGVL